MYKLPIEKGGAGSGRKSGGFKFDDNAVHKKLMKQHKNTQEEKRRKIAENMGLKPGGTSYNEIMAGKYEKSMPIEKAKKLVTVTSKTGKTFTQMREAAREKTKKRESNVNKIKSEFLDTLHGLEEKHNIKIKSKNLKFNEADKGKVSIEFSNIEDERKLRAVAFKLNWGTGMLKRGVSGIGNTLTFKTNK